MRNGKNSKLHSMSKSLGGVRSSGIGINLAVVLLSLIVLCIPHQPAHSIELAGNQKQQTYQTDKKQVQPINSDQPVKHCVKKIELKKQYLYMTDNWYQAAEQETKNLWQQSVIKRFGSVYGQWEVAQNKKYECQRIGFGNDEAGNIGASVVCLIAADPCVILLNR